MKKANGLGLSCQWAVCLSFIFSPRSPSTQHKQRSFSYSHLPIFYISYFTLLLLRSLTTIATLHSDVLCSEMKKTIQIILLLLLLNLSRSLSISSHGTLSDSEVRHIQRRQLLEFAERSQNVIVDPSLVFENPRLRNAYIALQAWKQAIFSDPFNFTANWIGSNVCNYTGVFCSPALDNRRIPTVAGINLNHADIAGYLPEELGLLSDLGSDW